jgi:hypothetical protein
MAKNANPSSSYFILGAIRGSEEIIINTLVTASSSYFILGAIRGSEEIIINTLVTAS